MQARAVELEDLQDASVMADEGSALAGQRSADQDDRVAGRHDQRQILTIGQRTSWDLHTVLVVGAGPTGYSPCNVEQASACVTGHDRSETTLVVEMGAVHHTGTVAYLELSPDIVVECRGVVPFIQQAADAVTPGGIVCLTGVASPSTSTSGLASSLATDAVLKNLVLIGSVNANRRHYYQTAKVLARADRSWFEQHLTRRVRPDDLDQALARRPDDIKVVTEFVQP